MNLVEVRLGSFHGQNVWLESTPPTYMVKVFVDWLNWIGTPSTSVGGVLFEHLSSHTVNECRVHFFIVGTSSASVGEFFLLASTNALQDIARLREALITNKPADSSWRDFF